MTKPLLQGNVPAPIMDLFKSWHSQLKNKKQKGLLLGACVVVAAKHHDEMWELFEKLAGADASDQVEGWLAHEEQHSKHPFKPRRAARGSRYGKGKDDSGK